MKIIARLAVGAALGACGLSAGGRAHGADLYSEGFDSAETAKVLGVNGPAVSVEFVDYSALQTGSVTHSIPEAPHRLEGSAATRGVLFRAVYLADPEDPGSVTTATDRIANLVAADAPEGVPLELTDNYRLRFDAYLRLSPDVTIGETGIPNEEGTTEQLLWGIGYPPGAGLPIGRSWRTGRGAGMWGWLTTEGGYGSTAVGGDAGLFQGPTAAGARHLEAEDDRTAYFGPAFGADATPVPYAPANQWVEVTVTALAGQVTVEYGAPGRQTVAFYENIPAADFVAGGVMVGYEDSFGSVSFDPDNQWLLVDNLVVEDLAAPTLVVTPVAPVPTYTGSPQPAAFRIANGRTEGSLTVSEVHFAGTDAAAFRTVTPLPLTVPPGEFALLEILFEPAAPDGVKSASMTIVSDDPQQPGYVISDLTSRRSVGTFFAARYKLDESEGAPQDSTENGAHATLQVREPVEYSLPSLPGEGETGTSLGFLPAQTPTTGNYFTSPVVHTPSFSISMWIRPASTGSDRTLFQRDFNFASPVDKIFGLYLTADGALSYRVRSEELLLSDPVVEDEAVAHVVLTHLDSDGFANETADRSRLFVNGALIAEATGTDARGFDDYPMNPVVSSLHVGSRTAAGAGYAGGMDDVQIYNAELTPEQVLALFQRPGSTAVDPPPDTPPLKILSAGLFANPPRFAVAIASGPAATYQLQRSGRLDVWENVGPAVPGSATGDATTLEDQAPTSTHPFYRVVQH